MKTTRLLALSVAPLALGLAPSSASAMTPDVVSTTGPTVESGPPVLHVRDILSNGSDRLDRLNQAYTDCLIDNGAPTIDPSSEPRPVPAGNISVTYGLTLDWPPPAGPRRACADVDPVFPPALGSASNPTFAAQAQSYLACLQGHGEWVRLLNDDNLDWTYRAGHDVPDNNAEIEDACLVGTFGSD